MMIFVLHLSASLLMVLTSQPSAADEILGGAGTEFMYSTTGPNYILDFNFENGLSGWVLGHSNGASWRHHINTFEGVSPPTGDQVLNVHRTDDVSGVVMATSPRLKVGPSGMIVGLIDFYMNGTAEYPAYLKLRRATSYTTFDDSTVVTLDQYGDQANQNWLQQGIPAYHRLTPGEEFNFVLEASLGINNKETKVAVSRLQIEGAELAVYDELDFFDFSNGLVGWSVGNIDGGRWMVYNHSEIDANHYIPRPTYGDNILIVDRFDIHAGVITIESPPINFVKGTIKELNIRFWMSGSLAYPASLRIRRKIVSGLYQDLPFLDLTPYGNGESVMWTELETSYPIPTEGIIDRFQLVLEADLGARENNLIAIDAVRITTRAPV